MNSRRNREFTSKELKMNNPRFVILTGHLNDYPLSDLVGILRHQRKTGRLLIEYAKGPAILFFHEGDLVDAKINELHGLQAICFVLGQPPASFNFNPLIQPSQRTIEKSLQRTVSELFGCWDESNVQIDGGSIDIPMLEEPAANVSPPALPTYQVERLALPAAPISSRPVSLLLMAAAALATLGVSTVIALSGGFRSNSASNAAPATTIEKSKSEAVVERAVNAQGPMLPKSALEGILTRSRSQLNRAASRKNDKAVDSGSATSNSESEDRGSRQRSISNSQAQAVTVVMEIEGGRVLRASIANPKPGMDSYEALALRIARQRRYPAQQNGRETVKIKVSPSEQ
jgi:Domain of unknown function (DUF4388)